VLNAWLALSTSLPDTDSHDGDDNQQQQEDDGALAQSNTNKHLVPPVVRITFVAWYGTSLQTDDAAPEKGAPTAASIPQSSSWPQKDWFDKPRTLC
jgi:hypothetical protein